MKGIIVSAIVALAVAVQGAPSQESSPVTTGAPVGAGLSDLDVMTFGCPKAALNAAARRAADVPTQGAYQFSYFRIISDSHHALYEVHFKSNYASEAELKYCVAMYCQQGWDPKAAKPTVTLMSNNRQPSSNAPHAGACSEHQTRAAGRPKR
jgi:hypothetical protein